jgi:lipoyl(octanoyl) transferase
MICDVQQLGLIPYRDAHDRQQTLVEQRKADEVPDTLMLLEHPHVLTLGRAADRGNILADEDVRRSLGVEVFETGRGGDVTYHGPGQLVAYPIFKLGPGRQDIRRYVRDLQEVILRTARDFGVEAEPRGGDQIGVWVGNEKLAAIGVRVSRWVTMHGFALNVTTDLKYFQLIVPCGLRGLGVTSLERLLGRPVAVAEVEKCVIQHFGDIFEREMTVASGVDGFRRTAIDERERIMAS